MSSNFDSSAASSATGANFDSNNQFLVIILLALIGAAVVEVSERKLTRSGSDKAFEGFISFPVVFEMEIVE